MGAENPDPHADRQFTHMRGLLDQAPTAPEIQPNPRQQNKIIRYMTDGDPRVLADPTAQITLGEEADFKRALAAGQIQPERISEMLGHIEPPVDQVGVEGIYKQVADDSDQRLVMAYLTGREQFSDRDIQALLNTFRDPQAFESQAQALLAQAKQSSPLALAQYRKGVYSLMHAVYGKQQEYWEQVQWMRQDAQRPGRLDWYPETRPAPHTREASRVPEIQANTRQQEKIVRYLLDGDPNILNQESVKVTPDEDSEVLRRIATGQIGQHHFSELLQQINSPAELHGVDNVFARIAGDPMFRNILANVGKNQFSQAGVITKQDFASFLEGYKDPAIFEPMATHFLAVMRHVDPGDRDKHSRYERAIYDFKHTLYGKRQQYWEQIQLMMRDSVGRA